MPATIKASSEKSVTIELTISLKESMLESEKEITTSLNEVGRIAAKEALQKFDTNGKPILMNNMKWTSKGRQNQKYQTQWGEIDVERFTYQSSKGGKEYCPLENNGRIILTSTPGFAKLVSLKYAELGAGRVLFDLEHSHQRSIAPSYIKSLCDAVGAVAQANEEKWTYELPKMSKPVSTVTVGIDGTCMLLTDDGWREAMVGTLSLYDPEGRRMHTIQMGATPEYGKKSFYSRFDKELSHIKEKHPTALFVGIADGTQANWTYLKPRTKVQILDFWHAAEYLGTAANAMFPSKKKSTEKQEWLNETHHNLKNKSGAATKILNEIVLFRDNNKLSEIRKTQLDTVITYFGNNKSRMAYAKHSKSNRPIGSGVTEAACKTLVKQRLCGSGMRWKEKGAASVLSLRALAHTDCRWEQFWEKLDNEGLTLAA